MEMRIALRYSVLFAAVCLSVAAWFGCTGDASRGVAAVGPVEFHLQVRSRFDSIARVEASVVAVADGHAGRVVVRDDLVSDAARSGDWLMVDALKSPAAYLVRLTAFDFRGDPLCVATSVPIDVQAGVIARVRMSLPCGGVDPGPPGGDGSASTVLLGSEQVCPSIDGFAALAEGGEFARAARVTMLVSGASDERAVIELAATSGSFDDAAASETIYRCDASGPQALIATVTDSHCPQVRREVRFDCE